MSTTDELVAKARADLQGMILPKKAADAVVVLIDAIETLTRERDEALGLLNANEDSHREAVERATKLEADKARLREALEGMIGLYPDDTKRAPDLNTGLRISYGELRAAREALEATP
jgi:ParB-like chromosome segregation protein Spo0J